MEQSRWKEPVHAVKRYFGLILQIIESFAAITATSRSDSKAVIFMNRKLPETEQKYQLALSVVNRMIKKGWINDIEYKEAESKLMDKFHPYISELTKQKLLAIKGEQSDVCSSTERSG